VLWVGTWAGLGFLTGTHMVTIYAAFEHYKWYVIGALVIAIAIVITIRVRRARTQRRA